MSEVANDVRAKVLIAEDDAIVALDLQGMVMRLGYDVVAIVDSGQAAVAAAKRFLPDIILLDIVLNGSMDGIDVAREIHASFDLPVVFCVSSPDLSILVRSKEISYAGYLLKPINPDSLATTLDTVFYKYKLEKRVQRAEEKFRALSEKSELVQFFFDDTAFHEWIWIEGEGLSLRPQQGSQNTAPVDQPLADLLKSVVARWVTDDPSVRISELVTVGDSSGAQKHYAVLGIKVADTGKITGMLIPLSCSAPACPPR